LVGGAAFFGWLPLDAARASYVVAGVTLLAVLIAATRFRAHAAFGLIFHGYARESDAPHEGFHVWFSWLITLVGLILIDQAFRDQVVVRTAALLLGVGDGVAEPVGIRWGRHCYRVPKLLPGRSSMRSVEGSLAAAAASAIVMLVSFPHALPAAAIVGLGTALVEAVSPHGLDNLTIPLAVAGLMLGLRSLEMLSW
jgi:dolichol kinase